VVAADGKQFVGVGSGGVREGGVGHGRLDRRPRLGSFDSPPRQPVSEQVHSHALFVTSVHGYWKVRVFAS
jgi:hypothetical protein